jgi:hypothetical protein
MVPAKDFYTSPFRGMSSLAERSQAITLSMVSERLLGHKISHAEISCANSNLSEVVKKWRWRDFSNLHKESSIPPLTNLLTQSAFFDIHLPIMP